MDEFYQLTSKEIKNKIGFIKRNLNKVIEKIKCKKFMPSKENIKIEDKGLYKYNCQISINKTIIKKRNSGVDLIRIVTMIGIIYAHLLYQGKVISKYNRYKKQLNSSFTYVFWHNNAFALISGIIGYKSTKYSNLLYLWSYVVFYSVGIHFYYLKYKQGTKVYGELYKEFFPVIYFRYWYFTSYFGMFFFYLLLIRDYNT